MTWPRRLFFFFRSAPTLKFVDDQSNAEVASIALVCCSAAAAAKMLISSCCRTVPRFQGASMLRVRAFVRVIDCTGVRSCQAVSPAHAHTSTHSSSSSCWFSSVLVWYGVPRPVCVGFVCTSVFAFSSPPNEAVTGHVKRQACDARQVALTSVSSALRRFGRRAKQITRNSSLRVL